MFFCFETSSDFPIFTSLSPISPRYLRFYLVASRKLGVSQRDSSIYTNRCSGHEVSEKTRSTRFSGATRDPKIVYDRKKPEDAEVKSRTSNSVKSAAGSTDQGHISIASVILARSQLSMSNTAQALLQTKKYIDLGEPWRYSQPATQSGGHEHDVCKCRSKQASYFVHRTLLLCLVA